MSDDSSDEVEYVPKCILVKGLPFTEENEARLEAHFEQKKKSGGGDIVDEGVIRTDENGVWIIEFEKNNSVLGALGKDIQKVKTKKGLCEVKVLPCPKDIYDRMKLKTGPEPKAEAEPQEDMSWESLAVETNQMEKCSSNTIVVKGFPEHVDSSFLLQHFGNQRNSASKGKVKPDGLHQIDHGTWLIRFEEPATLQSLMRRERNQTLLADEDKIPLEVIQCPKWLHEKYFGQLDFKGLQNEESSEETAMEVDTDASERGGDEKGDGLKTSMSGVKDDDENTIRKTFMGRARGRGMSRSRSRGRGIISLVDKEHEPGVGNHSRNRTPENSLDGSEEESSPYACPTYPSMQSSPDQNDENNTVASYIPPATRERSDPENLELSLKEPNMEDSIHSMATMEADRFQRRDSPPATNTSAGAFSSPRLAATFPHDIQPTPERMLQRESRVPPAPHESSTVRIQGLSPSTPDEMLKFYIETIDFKGSGKITEYKRSTDGREAIITFEDINDAGQINKMTGLCVDNQVLKTSRLPEIHQGAQELLNMQERHPETFGGESPSDSRTQNDCKIFIEMDPGQNFDEGQLRNFLENEPNIGKGGITKIITGLPGILCLELRDPRAAQKIQEVGVLLVDTYEIKVLHMQAQSEQDFMKLIRPSETNQEQKYTGDASLTEGDNFQTDIHEQRRNELPTSRSRPSSQGPRGDPRDIEQPDRMEYPPENEVKVVGVPPLTTISEIKSYFESLVPRAKVVKVETFERDTVITFEKAKDAEMVSNIRDLCIGNNYLEVYPYTPGERRHSGADYERGGFGPGRTYHSGYPGTPIGKMDKEIDAQTQGLRSEKKPEREEKLFSHGIVPDTRHFQEYPNTPREKIDPRTDTQTHSPRSVEVPESEEKQFSFGFNLNDPRLVIVTGFSSGTSNTNIKKYFKSPDRCGGGRNQTKIDKETNTAYMLFDEFKVAERVKKNQNLELKGKKLTVVNYQANKPKHQQEAPQEDNSKLMKDGNRTSGAIPKSHQSPDPMQGLPQQSASKSSSKSDEVDPHLVIVVNIPSDLSEDYLEMYFENKKKGGGDIKNFQYNTDERKAYIEFADKEVAKKVIAKRTFVIDKQRTMIAMKPRPPSPPPRAIEVRTTKSKPLNKKTLKLFLENKGRSGGGPIESLKMDPSGCIAYVVFRDAKDAGGVLQKSSLTLDGNKLEVSPHKQKQVEKGFGQASEGPHQTRYKVQGPVNTCAIDVYGVNPSTSEDTVRLFFENRGRSGGDTVDDMFYDAEKERYCITFEDPKVVNRILQKPQLELDNATFTVIPLEGSKDLLKDLRCPMDPKVIAVEGLTSGITTDHLKLLLEDVGGSVIAESDVIFGLQADVALVKYAEPPDFEKLRQHFLTKPVHGVMLNLKRIPTPSKLQVFSEVDISEEYLEMYMESTKKSGGGPLEDLTQSEGAFILKFKDVSVMHRVLQRDHSLEKSRLFVDVYYQELGLIPPDHDRTKRGRELPKVFVYAPEKASAMIFLETAEKLKSEIDDNMAKTQARIDWDRAIADNKITVQYVDSASSTLLQQLSPKKWKQNVQMVLDEAFKGIEEKEINTLKQAWDRVTEEIRKLQPPDVEECLFDFNSNANTIKIIGKSGWVLEFQQIINDINDKIMKDIERESKAAHETYDKVGYGGLVLMKKIGFDEDLMKAYNHLKIDINLERVVIEMKGLPQDILQVKVRLLEMNSSIKSKVVQYSADVIELMTAKECKIHVESALKEQKLEAAWNPNPRENILTVLALDQITLDNACKCMAKEVFLKEIPIPLESKYVFKTAKWKEFKDNIEKQHQGCLRMVLDNDSVRIGATSRVMDVALEEFENFVKEYTVLQQFIPMGCGFVRYMSIKMVDDLKQIELDFKSYSVRIEPDILRGGFMVHGTTYGAEPSIKKLKTVGKKVLKEVFKINKPGLFKYFNDPRGIEFIELLESRNNITIEMGDERVPGNQPGATLQGSTVLAMVTDGNCNILVVIGDLTDYKVDAVVNAANEDLKHYGGLARALLNKGGKEIQDDSDKYVKRHGKVTDGHVAVTTAGKLPCKKIIHAVGPKWKDGRSNEENYLFEAITRSLEIADGMELMTVALPALSTGVFGYPLQRATKTILEAVKDYFKNETASIIKEVHLVDNTPKTTDAFEKAMAEVYGRDKVIKGGAAGTTQRDTYVPRREIPPSPEIIYSRGQNRQSYKSNQQQKMQSTFVTRAASPHLKKAGKDSATTKQGLTVTLKIGEIAKEQVDVIVNSTAQNLQLSNGAISNSILKHGGSTIQDEATLNLPPNGLAMGDIVATSGGNLACTEVFHGWLCNWNGGKGGARQGLKSFIKNGLQKADSNGHSTIAFPAIGTGNLKFPHAEVAKLMFEEILKFNPTSLTTVYLSLYHGDKATIQAFRHEFQQLITGANLTPDVAPPKRTMAKPGKTYASAANEESAAMRGYSATAAPPRRGEEIEVTIGQVKLQIQTGDITDESTDAIVNSTNRSLDLSFGAIATAIVQKGGGAILEECSALGSTKDGIAVTTAGNLPSRQIIHVNAPHELKKWSKIIEKVLAEAESRRLNSVAFPALGTGNMNKRPNEMANLMLKTIAKFCEKKAQSLKLIRITIFEMRMVSVFCEELKNIADNPASGGIFSNIVTGFMNFFRSQEDEGPEPRTIQRGERHIQPSLEGTQMKPVEFQLYGVDKKDIQKVKGQLEENASRESAIKFLDSEYYGEQIPKLSREQVQQIEQLQNKFCVKITVERFGKAQIKLEGLESDLFLVMEEIQKIFRELDKEQLENAEAESLAKDIEWQYLFQGKFVPYPPLINLTIEKAYNDKKKKVDWTEDNGDVFEIDLRKMNETKNNSPSQTEVRRFDIKKAITGVVDLPKNWDAMRPTEDLKTVTLAATDQEYQDVLNKFQVNTRYANVFSIQRIQHPAQYKAYAIKKASMEKKCTPGTQVMRELWHGTSADTVQEINRNGFNRNYAGLNATVYGKGVYFAENPDYSARNQYSKPDQNGHKHMYLALVLTGEFSQGSQGLLSPPSMGKADPTVRYDSVVDHVNNPTIFVIFHDNQVYPQYLIKFN